MAIDAQQPQLSADMDDELRRQRAVVHGGDARDAGGLRGRGSGAPEPVNLSIVVAATNRPATIGACVTAIRAAMSPRDELIVVDDIAECSPAHIRNVGATRARGNVLVFVDADVLIHGDALDRLRVAYAADPQLVAAFGSYDDHPPQGIVSSFRNLLHHHVHHQGAGAALTFWAGLGAIRRDVFVATGGFDAERYPRPMIEDVELGLRLSSAGHRIVLMPEVQGRHLKRWTLGSMLSCDFGARGIPWTRMLIERREVPATLNLGWRQRATALTVLAAPAIALATRRPLALGVGVATVGALNGRFYALLWRRGGVRLTVCAIALHALHHATALSAMTFGVIAHLRRGRATPPELPLNNS